jgi:DNA-binding NarL/FixJ family response regulator
MRILIADDHDVVRLGLRELLHGHAGCEVCGEAGNGMEAVELARQLGPDLAILDLAMPRLDGLEATRRIRRELPGTEVLLFTVHASERLALEALAAGARSYVLKSHPASELLSAIESASRGARGLAPGPPCSGASALHANGARTTGQVLTAREREIVHLIADGKSNKGMAGLLGISVKTVETHRTHLLRKLGFSSVVQLVHYAVRNHMVDA